MSSPTKLVKVMRRELRRRKVGRACVIYVTVGWGGYMVYDKVIEKLGLTRVEAQIGEKASSLLGFSPDKEWAVLLLVAVLGLFVAAIFSWFYQMSATGLIRTPPFVERRILNNLAPLEDRRMEPPLHRKSTRHESVYDWVLEMESGPLLGLRYGVEDNIVVGRSMECDITVPLDRISREHSRFILDGSQLLVEDLNSSNGTAVNGTKIGSTVSLNHQDTVEILDVIIRIKESLAHAQARAQDATVMQNPMLHRKTKIQQS